MQEYSDENLEDDEETGLTSADKSKRRKKKSKNTRLDERISHDPASHNEEKDLAYQQLLKESVVNAILIIAWYGFSIGISVVSSPPCRKHPSTLIDQSSSTNTFYHATRAICLSHCSSRVFT